MRNIKENSRKKKDIIKYKISVVIPTHESKIINKVIKEVLKQKPFECIVIVDRCNKNIIKLKTCKVVLVNKHIFISESRMIGASVSKGNIIAFLDDDCIPQNNWLNEIQNKINSTDIIYGKRIANNTPNLNHREIKYRLRSGKYVEKKIKYFTSTNLNSMYLISGQNMAIKRELFGIFGFDNKFDKMGCEDIDFQFNVVEAGFIALYNPNMIVKHIHKHSAMIYFNKAIKYGMAEKLLETKHPIIKHNIWWQAYTPGIYNALSRKRGVILNETIDYIGRKIGRVLYNLKRNGITKSNRY